jgi:hypothetical protein
MALSLSLPSPINWLAVGLLPWANQKNALLVPFLLWLLPVPVFQEWLVLSLPSAIIILYLWGTKRLGLAKEWLWDVPKRLGKARTFRNNVLGGAKVLIPGLTLLAVPVAFIKPESPWGLFALVVAGGMVLSKQIVPHHFLLLTFPVALASEMTALGWCVLTCLWIIRDGLMWYMPKAVYPLTFPGYLELLEETAPIEKWLIDNAQGEAIWIDGMENHIIFNSMKQVTRIEIPELPGIPSERPKYVVWTYSFKRGADGKPAFDYRGYEPVMVQGLNGGTTKRGRFTLLRRVDEGE